MSDVASTAAAAAIRQTERASSGDVPTVTEPTNGLDADFETFLKLQTTQMRYQDPLQPMESTEFVSQLASFSSVEQQIETNKMLESVLERMNGGTASALSQWLGRAVLVDAPVDYDGGALTLYPEAAEDIAPRTAMMSVYDTEGSLIGDWAFEPGTGALAWDGTLGDGSKLAPGSYVFEARYADADGAVETAAMRHYAEVNEARLGADGPELVLEGDWIVDAADVVGVR